LLRQDRLDRVQQVSFSVVGVGKLFFSQAVTVFRDTPKVRSIPRKLLRSSYARKISSLRASEWALLPGFARLCLPQAWQRYFCLPFGVIP
jgi:hypothetical protein